MNRITRLFGATFLVLVFLASAPVQAQETKSPNVKKEMKAVLKELPPEMQLQILRYAERKRDAYVAMEAKKAEMAVAAAEAKKNTAAAAEQKKTAAAQPQPASIQLKPQQNNSGVAAQPAQPPQPKQPAYLEQAQKMAKTAIEWVEDDVDMGKLKQGEVASHTYRFKNVGDAPLKLTRVKPSCGCTTPQYSKEEIAPGEEGFIKVNFNTAGKSGLQRKTVTVVGNFEGYTKILRFKGEIQTGTPNNK
jgi:hypothetical protein